MKMGKFFKGYLTALAALTCSAPAYSDVIINEIMPCNITTYFNEEKDLTGWVELYNDGSKSVNIKGWTITNYNLKASTASEKIKWSWTIDKDINIGAKEYKVIPFDEYQPEENYTPKEVHSPYKVDPDGGSLEISDNKGFEYTLKYSKMKPHISYGTDEDGVNGYMVPTPKKVNGTAYKSLDSQCAKPTFGEVKPGVYPNSEKSSETPKKIKISSATTGATIRYTLNGSIPTETDSVLSAESSIKLSETRIIRARAFKSGTLPSDILTGSFIIYSSKRDDCSGKDAAVVSVVADDKFLTDPQYGMFTSSNESKSGIPGVKSCISNAANYNRDWQRGINFEFFENGEQKIGQEAVAGIMGGCSRKDDYKVKSLKISTNKRTGNETFNYKVYHNESTKKDNIYSSFQLRNGGNGYEELLCRDGFTQSVAKGIGNIDYQAYIPVGYFINGIYKGMMGLRERTNASYVKANYGLDEDKIDIVEFTQKRVEAGCGDLNAYNEMYNFVTDSANYKKENFVAQLDNYMDVEEYVNYMIFEQFIVNTDWPGNNQKIWRKHIGGKFRWILYDTDFGLGLYDGWERNYTNKSLNTITWCTGEGNEANWANANPINYAFDEEYIWKTKFFKCLMKNQGFKDMFVTKAIELLAGPLSGESFDKALEAFIPLVEKEYCANNKTDRNNYIDLESRLKKMVNFAKDRNSIYKNDLAKYCKLDVDKKTVLIINSKGDFKNKVEGFSVNNITEIGNSYKLKGFSGMNANIRPILPDGYIIKKWDVTTDTTLSYTTQALNVKLKGDTINVDLTIAEDTYDKPTIVINEICANSNNFIEPDSKTSSDWIELYNTGNDYVNVAGFYLSDNDTTIKIASGYEMTNIPPKGHLLLWADDKGKSGAQHLPFKLSSAGETIKLEKRVRDSVILVDKVTYSSIQEDYSYGREKDGSSKFTTFAACPNSEFSEATPGEENGKYNCETILDELTYNVNLACSFDRAKYNMNGKEVGPNKVNTYILKGKTLTVSPILPTKAYFVRWELSTPVDSYDSLVSYNSIWKYHSADSQPTGDWTAIKYDDAKWIGDAKGKMGYCDTVKRKSIYDTPIAHQIGDSAMYLATYFRHAFTLSDTTGLRSITASVLFDDAVAVYLNGKELCRYNLPSDTTLSYGIAASKYIDDLHEEFKIDPKLLKIGNNVLAAEVHQNDRASSDMTFRCYVKGKYHSKITKERSFTVTPNGPFSATLFVNDCTENRNTVAEQRELACYPNPTEGIVYLTTCDEETKINVYDQAGNLLLIQFVSDVNEGINLSKLPQGIYYLHATSSQVDAIGKVIKK